MHKKISLNQDSIQDKSYISKNIIIFLIL